MHVHTPNMFCSFPKTNSAPVLHEQNKLERSVQEKLAPGRAILKLKACLFVHPQLKD